MKEITKLKQLHNHPTGDCVRTVMACLLGYDDPELVPNFMEEMVDKFDEKFYKWLDDNDLEYMEVSLHEYLTCTFAPQGYCTLAGKSPRGKWNHLVVGIAWLNGMKRHLEFIHDTSPHHDGVFIDGDIEWVGFLTKKL